jgi:hypothetical protein
MRGFADRSRTAWSGNVRCGPGGVGLCVVAPAAKEADRGAGVRVASQNVESGTPIVDGARTHNARFRSTPCENDPERTPGRSHVGRDDLQPALRLERSENRTPASEVATSSPSGVSDCTHGRSSV